MLYLEKLMPTNCIYYNPIEKQFNLLCECVLYNDLVFTGLYHNKLTGKVNRFLIENIDATK